MPASINLISICIHFFNEKMENGGVIIVNRLSGIDLFVVLDMKWL